jgi:hypothetical protein
MAWEDNSKSLSARGDRDARAWFRRITLAGSWIGRATFCQLGINPEDVVDRFD